VQLLSDFRELFEAEPSDKLFVREILPKLADREDRRWSEWGKAGKPITGAQVATLLRPFNIKTNQTVGAETAKGYERAWFDDAFARYLAPHQRPQRHQRAFLRVPAKFSMGHTAGHAGAKCDR
jgi:hypothetical protein